MSLSSGTVGATINVKFPNPLDNPGLHAQVFGQGNDYEMNHSVRPGFGALLSDTFLDGKLGFLIDFDYLDSHIEGHHQDIVGWKGTYLHCSHSVPTRAARLRGHWRNGGRHRRECCADLVSPGYGDVSGEH